MITAGMLIWDKGSPNSTSAHSASKLSTGANVEPSDSSVYRKNPLRKSILKSKIIKKKERKKERKKKKNRIISNQL